MKKIIVIIFILLFSKSFSQDTSLIENQNGKYVFIKENGLVIEKIHYQKDTIVVRVVFYYSEGLLRKRIYYNKENKIIATIFD